MQIKHIIQKYSQQLKSKSSSSILDIELLLTKVLNKPKEYLFTYPEKKLTASQFKKFEKLFQRRLKGEPIAYIVGYKEFFGLKFQVNKKALIPRPETEILVEETIKYCNSEIRMPKAEIIDIGSGSGAIIIALAKNLKKWHFFGTEISAPALKIARANAKKHQVKIIFLKGNLLEPITKIRNSDFVIRNSIITANLPYLTTQELKNSSIQMEPKIALAGGPDGLKYFRQLFSQIQKFSLKPLAIFLEIGHNQAAKIKKLAQLALPKYKFQIKKDLCGHDRVLIISK